MKKIYAIEAFRFGFKTFFKNPLFLLVAFLITKLIGATGLLLSILISMPFFLPLLRAVSKIIGLVKHILAIIINKLLPLKTLLAGGMKEGVSTAGGISDSGGGLLGGLFGGIGKAVKGVVPLAKAGKKLIGAKDAVSDVIAHGEDIKEVALNVLKNPWILSLFISGIIVFIILIKLLYDYIILGWTNMSLDFSKQDKSSFSSLFTKPKLFFRYFVATMFFSIIILFPSNIMFIISPLPKGFIIGLILFIIVSTYLTLSFWFYPYFLIDKNSCILESFGLSYRLQGSFINLFLLYLIILAIILPITVISILLIHIFGFFISWFIFAVSIAIMWIIAFLSTAYLYTRLNIEKNTST